MPTAPAGGSMASGDPDATASVGAFVCAICGVPLEASRESCPNCRSNLVVPVDDGTVYETIIPMCDDPGPARRPNG